MENTRAMSKAKDLALQDLQNRCRAAEALCKVLDSQSNQYEVSNDELKAKMVSLEASNLNLTREIEKLAIENQNLYKALTDASNEVDQVTNSSERQFQSNLLQHRRSKSLI
jgi:competence protein ComGC